MPGTTKSLREIVSILQKKDLKATFLGIGPMSEVVIRAALELARDKEFPVMLIASRNQVDSDELGGGYVMGWNQKSFSEAVNRIAHEVGFDGLLYLCRDHGGPWQRDNERYGNLPAEKAMQAAKVSYLADLEAGFNLIHVDPTKDPHCSGAVPIDLVLERTVELMGYVEEQARRLGLSGVSYEVGTEETAGGLISAEAFEQFISELLQKLDKRNLHHPAFIVGQTGTLVKMDRNVGHFDPENSQRLCQIARRHGLGFKEHNADYLPLDALETHPDLGITGANVAPEFGLMETRALLELSAHERKAIDGVCIEPSDLASVIQKAALESGRWKKWLVKEDAHLTEEDIIKSPEKLAEVTDVCGHYVFNQADVRNEREKLYDNLIALRATDSPETKVVEAVKESIMRYVDAFNLEGINSHLI